MLRYFFSYEVEAEPRDYDRQWKTWETSPQSVLWT